MKRRPDSHDEYTNVDVVSDASLQPDETLPVVARLVVEIRSDGSRTIARGAVEDRVTGQQTAIEARGDSPMSLALDLARSMIKLPSLARTTARALLPGRRRRR